MSNLLGLEEEKQQAPIEAEPADLAANAKKGANWFYWIAGLSVVNSLAYASGADFAFVMGLGITLIIDVIADAFVRNGGPSAMKAVAVAFDFLIVGVFVLAGVFSGRRMTVAWVAGIAIYFIDTLIVLLLGDWMMTAFHCLALFFIVRGFLASMKLNKLDAGRTFQSPAV